jgi:hypothetical protein
MNYNVKVLTAGTYKVSFRVATAYANTGFQLRAMDGTVLATILLIHPTGGYQAWQTVSTVVTLPAGKQTLQLYSTSVPYWNFNWMEFEPIPVSPPVTSEKVIPGKIEAESYDKMISVSTQPTSDANGGLNVDYITNGSWMNYNVKVLTAGTYIVSFRVATINDNTGFELRAMDGTVLATILLIHPTGGYQTWQTVSTVVTLPAGDQTLQLYSTSVPYWNLNWMEFTNAKAAAQAQTTTTTVTSAQLLTADSLKDAFHSSSSFTIYPNPVKDNLSIDINNNYTGKMRVWIVNQSGNIVKAYSLIKDRQYSHVNLPSGYLSPGTYIVRIQIGSWSQTGKLLKL